MHKSLSSQRAMEGSTRKHGRLSPPRELNTLTVLSAMTRAPPKLEFSRPRLEFGGRMGRDIVRHTEDAMAEACDTMVCC